jgi:hypothetical protein
MSTITLQQNAVSQLAAQADAVGKLAPWRIRRRGRRV